MPRSTVSRSESGAERQPRDATSRGPDDQTSDAAEQGTPEEVAAGGSRRDRLRGLRGLLRFCHGPVTRCHRVGHTTFCAMADSDSCSGWIAAVSLAASLACSSAV